MELMKSRSINNDMFFGTTEKYLDEIRRNLDIGEGFPILSFVYSASEAYTKSQYEMDREKSPMAIIHLNGGIVKAKVNGNRGKGLDIKLNVGKALMNTGLERLEGFGEVRTYIGGGMSGLDFFKKVYL